MVGIRSVFCLGWPIFRGIICCFTPPKTENKINKNEGFEHYIRICWPNFAFLKDEHHGKQNHHLVMVGFLFQPSNSHKSYQGDGVTSLHMDSGSSTWYLVGRYP